jgi:hypothetical protein
LLVLFPVASGELASAARRAHADVMVALGLLVAFDAYLRWSVTPGNARRQPGTLVVREREREEARLEPGDPRWVGLGSLGLAFALWSKHESQLYVVAFLAAALVFGLVRPRRLAASLWPSSALVWCLPPLAVIAITWSHNAWFDVGNHFMSGGQQDRPFPLVFWSQLRERLPGVAHYFWREVLLQPRSNYVFLLVPALAALRWRACARGPAGVTALALLFSFAGVIVIFVGLPHDLAWHLGTAASRVAAQLIPVSVLWIGAVSGGWYGNEEEKEEPGWSLAVPGVSHSEPFSS